MKVLVTGIAGVTGSHLADVLFTRPDVEGHGTIRWQEGRNHICGIENRLSLHECDLRDAHGVERVIKQIQLAHFYYLEAETRVGHGQLGHWR